MINDKTINMFDKIELIINFEIYIKRAFFF